MLFREFKHTLKLAIPLIISDIAQVGHGLIDSAMVGSINYKLLAASSLVINSIAIPQVICIGFTIAITAMVSISRGQKNDVAASRYLYNGFLLNTGFSVLVALACTFSAPLLEHLGQDPDIVPLAKPYFISMAWALVPMTMFLSIKQFSDALEYTRTGMMLALISLPLNAFLCWLLIYGNWGMPRLELIGAGLATFISRLMVAIVMAIIVYRHKAYHAYMSVRRQAWKYSTTTMKELLHIGIPSGMQLSMEAGAFSVSGIMVGWLGASAQAAHQIALNCASATFMAVLGLSMGASIRTAHAFGGKQMHRLSLIGRSTMAGGLIYGICTGLLFIVFRYQLPLLFNTEPAVIVMAGQLILVAAIFQVSDSLQAIGAGLCRGIKDVKVPTVLVTVAYWVIGIPAGYWLAFKQGMGAAGIWWGFVIGLTMAAIFLNKRFLKMVKALQHS